MTKKKRITIDYEGDLGDRLKESAARNKRSLNKHIQYLLEECLQLDEKYHSISEEQKAVLKKIIKNL